MDRYGRVTWTGAALCHRLLLRENNLTGDCGMRLWFQLLGKPRQRNGLSLGPV